MQKKVRYFLLMLLGSVFVPLVALHATDYSSTNFIIKDPVIVPGAGFSTSANFQLDGLFGQTAIGFSSTTSFQLKGGFLYFGSPSAAVTGTQSVVIIVPPGGGGLSIPIIGPVVPPKKLQEAIALYDFNGDGVINIVDFSVMLYYFNQSGSEVAQYDLNNDNVVNIIDISILLYYWI